MQGKRYVASNMRLALKMVREDLGPDAVILSNKQVPEGVELLTAVESPFEQKNGEESLQASAMNANPFVQDDVALQKQADLSKTRSNGLSDKTSPPSRLEIEVERMRLEARERAKELAATLSDRYKNDSDLQDSIINTDKLNQNKNDNVQLSSVRETSAVDLQTPQHDFKREVAAAIKEQDNQIYSTIDDDSVGASETYEVKSACSESTASTSIKNSVSNVIRSTELETMRHEMQSMRELLEQQLSSMAWGQYNHNAPEKASQWRRLKRMGISAHLAHSLVDNINNTDESTESWQAIMANLSRRLPVMNEDMVANGGIFALVGPTGAGKTTTIGKLAARYVLTHGATHVALVTTDTQRIASQEQLRTVARILNVPMKVVDNHNTLDRVLYSLRHKSLVLIDTAGLNPATVQMSQQLREINEQGEQVKTLLVIPTTSQEQVIKAAYHSYKTDNLCGCIFTKLDESGSLGESISLAVEKNLTIAYNTNGQNIPDDIAVADKVNLVKLAIKLAKHQEVDDIEMADEFASLSQNNA